MKQTKQILEYSAIFEPAKEGGYNVSFPSFPGCFTFGRNFEEAKLKAKEILELWLEELAHQGGKAPVYKRRPKLIASALGLIFLLVILIIP